MHRRFRSARHALVILFALALPAAWAQSVSDAPRHPLISQVWDTRARQPASLADVEHRLRSARYMLLGEVHDNSIHHRMRRDLIASLVRDGRRPAIAMEQFNREQQAALDATIADAPRNAERLRSETRFDEQGWHWPDYAPIISIAMDFGLQLLAANLSRADAFRIATSSTVAVIGDQAVRALGLDQPLLAIAQRKLERVIDDGHCGKAPAKILPGMVAAQRARDAVMANVMQQHSAGGVVLVAGNGHVRRDFGVPHYLLTRTAADTIVAVGFIEVQEKRIAPADYYDTAQPEYDYIVFTERMAREDPCATLSFKPRQPMAQP